MPAPRWYEPYTTPGETLLWEGAPAENAPLFQKEDAKSLLFLPFLGFGGFILYTIATSGAPAWVLGGFGVIIGVWVLGVLLSSLAPLLYRLWLTPELAYAVTNRRILRYRRGTVDALDIVSLPKGRVLPTREGCGTITFAIEQTSQVHISSTGFRFSMSMPQDWLSGLLRTSLASLDGFDLYNIADAEAVLALIRSVEPSIPDLQPLSDTPLLPLEDGERLLWQGRPERPPFGFDYDWLNIMPGLFALCIGLMVVVIIIAPTQGDASKLPLWLFFSIPLAIGLFLLFGRSLLQRWQMRRTIIVVTDRRILRSVGGKVEAFVPGETIRMGLFQGQDGCGSVLLGDLWATKQAYRPESTRQQHSFNAHPGFQLPFIPDAARCMDAISALRKEIAP